MICNCVPTHFYHICTDYVNSSQLVYVATKILINYGKSPADTENANAADLPCTFQHTNLHTSNLFKSPLDSDSKLFLFLEKDSCDISWIILFLC